MKIYNTTLKSIPIINLATQIVVICITIFITTQPILETIFEYEEVAYHLYDDMEEKDSSKKEELNEKSEKEKKSFLPNYLEPEISYTHINFSFDKIISSSKHISKDEHVLGVSQEVIAPPPEAI